MINIRPLPGIGEIGKGDDIGAILADALAPLRPEKGDILVVTSKILSKAEGRAVLLENVAAGSKAQEIAVTIGKDARLIELVLAESTVNRPRRARCVDHPPPLGSGNGQCRD